MNKRLMWLGCILILMIAAVSAIIYHRVYRLDIDRSGCAVFREVAAKVLVAHAGGGTPSGRYLNSIGAMNLSYDHGFKYMELDFVDRGGLLLEHDPGQASAIRAADLFDWLRKHPGIFIVTDFKDDNVAGLTRLAREAGPLRIRFIPQIYQPSEYESVARLGFQKPILTLYRLKEDGWVEFAEHADIQAVTMPLAHASAAKMTTKPVFLHTVNVPEGSQVYGYYTDCLTPPRSQWRK